MKLFTPKSLKMLVCLQALLLFAGPNRGEALAQIDENNVLPAIALNLARYVEWPDNPRPHADASFFYIGVYASDNWLPFFQPLEGEKIHGLTVKIIRLSNGMDMNDFRRCHMIFTADEAGLAHLRPVASRSPTLLLTDQPGSASAGLSAVEFVPRGSKLSFEIALKPIRGSNLQIKSNVLKLASAVYKD